MNVFTEQKTQVFFLRIIVLLTGIYQIINEPPIGLAILLCLFAISFPSFVSRNRVKALPVEFEIILFIMVILQFVIGETFNFYENVPYYDKLVHFSLPFFLGYIAWIMAYTLRVTGALNTSLVPTLIAIIIITLGIGALWEIFEYLCDVFLGTYFQGSITASPLVDTMNDLIVDLLGGIFGALLAVRYVKKESKHKQSRLNGLVKEIVNDF